MRLLVPCHPLGGRPWLRLECWNGIVLVTVVLFGHIADGEFRRLLAPIVQPVQLYFVNLLK